MHDHPFDFTSTVVAGEMTNTRYEEDSDGVEYHRVRYSLENEDARTADTVRLSGTPTTVTAGECSTPSSRTSCTTAGRFRAR